MSRLWAWIKARFTRQPLVLVSGKLKLPPMVKCKKCKAMVPIWKTYRDGQVLCVPCAAKVKP